MHKKTTALIAISSFLLCSLPVYAVDLPPRSASSDILQKRAVDDAKKKLLEQKPVEDYVPPAVSPAPAQPEVTFLLKKINLRAAAAMPEHNQRQAEKIFPAAESFLRQFENKKTSFRQLNEIKDNTENFFRAKGYFAVISIPPQKSQAGEVTFEVLLSEMGKLNLVKPLRYGRSRRLLAKWRIPEGAILRYDIVQKSLEAMNSNADRSISPVFKAGEKAGSTDVYLEPREQFPIHPSYSFDNRGAKSVGKLRNGFNLRDSNFLTLDDTLQIGTSFGSAFGVLYVQHMLPLNDYGTRLVNGYSFSKVAPQKEFAASGVLSVSQNFSTAVYQDLWRTERVYASAYLGFDFKDKTTVVQNTTEVWDRLRVLSAGSTIQYKDRTGFWSFGPDFYVGIPIRGDGYSLNSRGAETSFWKTSVSLTRYQNFFWDTQAIFRVDAQLSPDRLMPEEQKTFGGADTIRGYPEADYLADQGLVFSAEYHAPFFLVPKDWQLPRAGVTLRKQITMISFFDHGYGMIHGPLPTEDRRRKMTGVGGGFSVRLKQYVSLRCLWAAALGAEPLTEGGRSQFHFALQSEI